MKKLSICFAVGLLLRPDRAEMLETQASVHINVYPHQVTKKTRLPGSIHIPKNRFNYPTEELVRMIRHKSGFKAFNRKTPVKISCPACPKRAKAAAELLRQKGFSSVTVLPFKKKGQS